ncbi:MAG: glycoside hydrolase family 30 beta sandwich domain-containing protein [Polyangiales bacterium]
MKQRGGYVGRLLVAMVGAGCSSATSPNSQSGVGSDAGTTELEAGGSAHTPDADILADAAKDSTDPDTDRTASDVGGTEATSPSGPTAYVTTPDLSQALASVPVVIAPKTGVPDVTIAIDATVRYQSILGFGASITDSSSYVLTKHLSAAALRDALIQLFDPSLGIGLSLLRQPIGASDFSSVGDFSYDDGGADPTLAHFSLAQDLKATIPVLQQVMSINSGVFVLGTPWSAPAWMKLNGSMDGSGGAAGNSGLSGSAYQPFADYFVQFVQGYAAHGIRVAAVTPQNEPLNGSANYPGMDLGASWELQLIAQNLGPALQRAGLSTQIWAYDHNWDQESYPAQVLGDATAGGFTEGAAFHCYGGDPSAMTTFHDHYPDKSVYMTECSGGAWQSDPWANTIDLILDSTANWARAVSLWNLALDEHAGPQNHGCNDCRGVVTVDSGTNTVTYNVDYYALGHFSKFVQRGAVRIGSTASGNVKQVAFANPDGSFALVAHESGGADSTMEVATGTVTLRVRVPANGGVTLVWR